MNLASETPMTGHIKSETAELPHAAQLVLYQRFQEATRRYVSQTETMVNSRKTARAAQSEVARCLASLLEVSKASAVAEALSTWKAELLGVDLSLEEPEPVKILLYGGTGEGKSALVSALLDMPGIAPSDCAGSAVTSCTMIYNYRPHDEKKINKPESANPVGWAPWLWQIANALPVADSGPCKYGAKLHFMKPSAFIEQRKLLVESIANYWLRERKEARIQARLPPNDRHEAYFATQTLVEWYGSHLFSVEGWGTGPALLDHLKQKDPQIAGLQMLLGLCGGPNVSEFEGGVVYSLEEDDASVFCSELREWVTVSTAKRMAPFLSHVEVFLPSEALQGVRLIDAAGLGDDNRKRHDMAESLVAASDFVWVLARLGGIRMST